METSPFDQDRSGEASPTVDKKEKKLGQNKNYMSIAGIMVFERKFSELSFVLCGQDNARKSRNC